jgi:hypothetical protein
MLRPHACAIAVSCLLLSPACSQSGDKNYEENVVGQWINTGDPSVPVDALHPSAIKGVFFTSDFRIGVFDNQGVCEVVPFSFDAPSDAGSDGWGSFTVINSAGERRQIIYKIESGRMEMQGSFGLVGTDVHGTNYSRVDREAEHSCLDRAGLMTPDVASICRDATEVTFAELSKGSSPAVDTRQVYNVFNPTLPDHRKDAFLQVDTRTREVRISAFAGPNSMWVRLPLEAWDPKLRVLKPGQYSLLSIDRSSTACDGPEDGKEETEAGDINIETAVVEPGSIDCVSSECKMTSFLAATSTRCGTRSAERCIRTFAR